MNILPIPTTDLQIGDAIDEGDHFDIIEEILLQSGYIAKLLVQRRFLDGRPSPSQPVVRYIGLECTLTIRRPVPILDPLTIVSRWISSKDDASIDEACAAYSSYIEAGNPLFCCRIEEYFSSGWVSTDIQVQRLSRRVGYAWKVSDGSLHVFSPGDVRFSSPSSSDSRQVDARRSRQVPNP